MARRFRGVIGVSRAGVRGWLLVLALGICTLQFICAQEGEATSSTSSRTAQNAASRKSSAKLAEDLYLIGMDAYADGNDAKARAFWEQALETQPGFAPAKEGLAAIEEYKRLADRIYALPPPESGKGR